MSAFDHEYYVRKIEEQERELKVYRDCFLNIMKWFNKNKNLLKDIPVSHRPKVPTIK